VHKRQHHARWIYFSQKNILPDGGYPFKNLFWTDV